VPTALLFVPLWGCAPDREPAPEYSGRILPFALDKPDFTFTDFDGLPYDFRKETEGFVTLLFFGYTNCPDVCPIQMANIGAVLRDLPAETQRRIKVVFVTTDPDRDTPERMRDWLGAIHPSFIGLTGPLDRVNEIENELLLPRSIIEKPHGDGGHAEQNYDVGHASPVVAFTADGFSRVMFPYGTRQQDWRRDLPRLVADLGESGS